MIFLGRLILLDYFLNKHFFLRCFFKDFWNLIINFFLWGGDGKMFIVTTEHKKTALIGQMVNNILLTKSAKKSHGQSLQQELDVAHVAGHTF